MMTFAALREFVNRFDKICPKNNSGPSPATGEGPEE
jgi:hypothetical protein